MFFLEISAYFAVKFRYENPFASAQKLPKAVLCCVDIPTSFPGSLFFPSHGARERERPWYGLVTCVYENWRRQGGVLVFQLLLSFFYVTVKTRLSCSTRVFSRCFFSLYLAPWDGKKRDPGKEVDHCWDSSVVWHLVDRHFRGSALQRRTCWRSRSMNVYSMLSFSMEASCCWKPFLWPFSYQGNV